MLSAFSASCLLQPGHCWAPSRICDGAGWRTRVCQFPRVGLHGQTHQTTQRATSTQTYANLVKFFLCKKTNKRRHYLPGGTWPWAAPRDLGCWAAGVRCWGAAGCPMGCSSNWWSEGKWQGRAQRWVKSLRQNCKVQLSQHIQTWQFWTMKCKS